VGYFDRASGAGLGFMGRPISGWPTAGGAVFLLCLLSDARATHAGHNSFLRNQFGAERRLMSYRKATKKPRRQQSASRKRSPNNPSPAPERGRK